MVAICADDIFRRIFLNISILILIAISPKFVPNDTIDYKSTLVAWTKASHVKAMLI